MLSIKKLFLEQGWITLNKDGNRQYLILTEKGKEIVEAADYFLNKLGIDTNNMLQFRASMKLKKEEEIVVPEKVEPIQLDETKVLFNEDKNIEEENNTEEIKNEYFNNEGI